MKIFGAMTYCNVLDKLIKIYHSLIVAKDWIIMGDWFADAENAQRLRQLVAERLQRDANCPGITHDWDDYGEFYRFRVGHSVFVTVEAYIDADNMIGSCRFCVINGPDARAYYVRVDGDIISLCSSEDDRYQRIVNTIGARIEHGYISTKLHMPYGYVEDGVVTAIWFCSLFDGNVPGSLCTNVQDFALEGHDLPSGLLGRGQDDPEAYVARYWQQVHSGHIIELGQRVQAHPGKLLFISSGVAWPQLVFTDSDSELPHIPANVPYFLRLASDPAGTDLPRTRQVATGYLSAGRRAANLTEFFASRGESY